jgi:DNA-binding response OmpR family regulator
MLMEHPGEMIPRENALRQVWDTTYAGDMRTLDVHISWLRRAIEDDPHTRAISRRCGHRLPAGRE